MSNIHVIELNEYTRPEVHEQKNRDWVSIGDNNNFFGYLIDRYLNSPTNGTIINSITSQVYGKGLNAYDASKMPDEFAQMKSLFKKQVRQSNTKKAFWFTTTLVTTAISIFLITK